MVIAFGLSLPVIKEERFMHSLTVIVPGGHHRFESSVSPIDFHWDCWLPTIVVHTDFSAISGAPKDHELFREFGSVRVFEKVNPPPPVPRAVLEHVFRIDSPDVIEDFVHGGLQIRRPQRELDMGTFGGCIKYQVIVCSVMSIQSCQMAADEASFRRIYFAHPPFQWGPAGSAFVHWPPNCMAKRRKIAAVAHPKSSQLVAAVSEGLRGCGKMFR